MKGRKGGMRLDFSIFFDKFFLDLWIFLNFFILAMIPCYAIPKWGVSREEIWSYYLFYVISTFSFLIPTQQTKKKTQPRITSTPP